jgi:ring-1,2-phenylacetyl-CoA epoxidase subunit PaaC
MSLPDQAPIPALRRRILSLADTKRLLGIRYSDWLLGAPSIEDGIACSGMAQDEWGHARLLYALFKEWDEDPMPIEQDREPGAYANAPPLDEPLEEWTDVVAVMYALDGAVTVALEALGSGRFEVAAGRIPKMLGEERYHRDLAAAWLRRLAGGADEGAMRLRRSMERVLPSTLAWLAPADDLHESLTEAGFDASATELETAWIERIREGLDLLGLPAPMRTVDWDPTRARGPGEPDADAVERARGVRNRMLFVE